MPLRMSCVSLPSFMAVLSAWKGTVGTQYASSLPSWEIAPVGLDGLLDLDPFWQRVALSSVLNHESKRPQPGENNVDLVLGHLDAIFGRDCSQELFRWGDFA